MQNPFLRMRIIPVSLTTQKSHAKNILYLIYYIVNGEIVNSSSPVLMRPKTSPGPVNVFGSPSVDVAQQACSGSAFILKTPLSAGSWKGEKLDENRQQQFVKWSFSWA